MRPCSSSGMDRRILLYTRFPAGVVRPFDGTTRFRRLFSVGSCFWFSNGSPETLRTLCDKPASLFLGASWGQLSLTPHLFKLCRRELSKSMPQRSGGVKGGVKIDRITPRERREAVYFCSGAYIP